MTTGAIKTINTNKFSIFNWDPVVTPRDETEVNKNRRVL
nr:hypothetical protein [Rickettsia conorii]